MWINFKEPCTKIARAGVPFYPSHSREVSVFIYLFTYFYLRYQILHLILLGIPYLILFFTFLHTYIILQCSV